jgi:hypothetical protein
MAAMIERLGRRRQIIMQMNWIVRTVYAAEISGFIALWRETCLQGA